MNRIERLYGVIMALNILKSKPNASLIRPNEQNSNHMNSVLKLIVLMCLPLIHPVKGQDPALKEDVDAIIEKYNNASDLKMDFELKVVYPEQEPANYSGEYYQNGKYFRVVLEDYEVYSDQKSQWTVLKENKEVQITSVDEEGAELSSPSGVLKYLGSNDFKYFDKSSLNTSAKPLQIIELIPLDKSSEYFKIRITNDLHLNELKYVEVFARDGSRFQLTIKNSSFSSKLAVNSVRWNAEKYKDYYIEDLRID